MHTWHTSWNSGVSLILWLCKPSYYMGQHSVSDRWIRSLWFTASRVKSQKTNASHWPLFHLIQKTPETEATHRKQMDKRDAFCSVFSQSKDVHYAQWMRTLTAIFSLSNQGWGDGTRLLVQDLLELVGSHLTDMHVWGRSISAVCDVKCSADLQRKADSKNICTDLGTSALCNFIPFLSFCIMDVLWAASSLPSSLPKWNIWGKKENKWGNLSDLDPLSSFHLFISLSHTTSHTVLIRFEWVMHLPTAFCDIWWCLIYWLRMSLSHDYCAMCTYHKCTETHWAL